MPPLMCGVYLYACVWVKEKRIEDFLKAWRMNGMPISDSKQVWEINSFGHAKITPLKLVEPILFELNLLQLKLL